MARQNYDPEIRAASRAARTAVKQELEKRGIEEEVRDAAQAGLPPPILDVEDEEEAGQSVAPVTGAPDWVRQPPNFTMPVGWTIWYVRFRANQTNTPSKGDRHCILWNLSEADEKLAARRCLNNANRAVSEMTKQMIRAVDGVLATPEARDVFWSEIGGKGRAQLHGLYARTHMMDEKENTDFFASCIASRTAG